MREGNQLATGDTMDKQWYAIHTFSGYENRVKTMIEHRVQLEGMREKVAQVMIPLKKTIEIKNGKKREVMVNNMPGYVFIQMEQDEEIFALVQKIPGVSSFLGEGATPSPLPTEEVANLLDSIEEKADKPKAFITYKINDQVKVIEGPFANFIGVVEQVDQEKSKLKVMVSIFGRPYFCGA
jgi:transcription termination/antitermination protein NusG